MPILLRLATDDDSSLFFRLRNDPEAIKFSLRGGIAPDEHFRWWYGVEEHRFVAIELDEGYPVGIIRVALNGRLSIIVDPDYRGLGYGPDMLDKIIPIAANLNIPLLTADVLYDNERSQGAFLRAEWRPVLFQRRTSDDVG